MPAKYRFPERNRIISGLSNALLVIEAPPRSGSLITADFCIEQNRDLYFHSAGIESGVGCGAEGYVQEGAAVVTSAGDVLRAAGWERRVAVHEHQELMDILEYDLTTRAGEQ